TAHSMKRPGPAFTPLSSSLFAAAALSTASYCDNRASAWWTILRPLFVAGRISIARTQRGSVTPDGVERLSHASCACAGIVNDGDRTMRSGGPPNCFAKFQTDASGHWIATRSEEHTSE